MPTISAVPTLRSMAGFATAAHIPLSTLYYWSRSDYRGFRTTCVVPIDKHDLIDTMAAQAWLAARPRRKETPCPE